MPVKQIIFALSIAATCQFGAAAAGEFPYDAYVAVDQAEVVAGPGHRYYATDRLPRGTKIAIYREEPSGWLAIQPPDGAFSWTPAESIERLKDDMTLGRVKQATPAWIGTAAEQVSEHRQQVTLKAGEMVQILGDKTISAADEKQKWLKIAPPAGEFRWIHLRDVSRQMPAEEPSFEEQPEKALTPAFSQRTMEETVEDPQRFHVGQRAIALTEIEPAGGTHHNRQVEQAQFHSSAGSATTKPLSSDGFVARKRRAGETTQPLVTTPAPNFRASSQPNRQPLDSSPRIATSVQPARAQPISANSPPTNTVPAGQFQQQLEQIEVDLSLMLAQDRSLWDLAPLRQRIGQLVEQGSDPVARGQARLLLDKLKQFEEAFDVAGYGPIRSNASQPAAPPAAEQPRTEKGSPADPRYDAQGWLKPVVSRKSDKPAAPYAIVDQAGQPVCFITPSPGLNLNRYLNKQVGLYGRRGMLEELNKPHVLAERVIDLERSWR